MTRVRKARNNGFEPILVRQKAMIGEHRLWEQTYIVEVLENYREIRRTTEATTIILIDQQVSVGRPSNKYNVALVAAKAKFGLAICERDSTLDRVLPNSA